LDLKAVNNTRKTLIASKIQVAETFFRRWVGLLGQPDFGEGAGLWISPCKAIHTFWMRFPIDVIFLDADHKVVKTAASVKPFRICFGEREAKSVLELTVGTIERSRTQPGDQIHFIEDA
jgi:uncharacterized membrane protein (UPF0127 family)